MRVLLVDDHELVWNGTRRLLEDVARRIEAAPSLDFVAVRSVADSLAHAVEPFDLILLDYHLPDKSGLEALRALQAAFESSPVCLLSGETQGSLIREVLEAGAAGFIPKSYGQAEMADAMRLVLRQRVYVPAEFLFAQDIVRGRTDDEVPSADLKVFLRSELSPRQRQVLRLALQGLSNKSIARQLDITEGTVKVHLSMVYRALGVNSRVAALCRVLQADAAVALE